MAQQKIAEGAAEGYRVISVIPTDALASGQILYDEKQDSAGSGLTIVLKHSDLKQVFDYRLIVLRDSKDFIKALNQFGADGFRLVSSSLQFAWAEQRGIETILFPEAYSIQQKHGTDMHLALMEKAPNDSAKYSYQQVPNVRHIEKLAARGYRPVSGSILAHFVVLEAQTPSIGTAHIAVQHARIAKFNPNATAYPDITVESNGPIVQDHSSAPNNGESQPELDVKLDVGAISGKKLLLLNDGTGMFVFTPIIDVLTASGEPDTPALHRLILRNDFANAEKAVNDSGAQGFRLFPRIGTAYRIKNQIHGTRVLGVIPALDLKTTVELLRTMAVMYPGASGYTYRYRILSPTGPADLLKKLNAADVDGFQFVSLSRGTLVMESEHLAGGSR
jgi:hypothetical protein